MNDLLPEVIQHQIELWVNGLFGSSDDPDRRTAIMASSFQSTLDDIARHAYRAGKREGERK